VPNKPILTIDFDDIIDEFFSSFLTWCNKENGTTLTYEEFRDYGDHTLLHPDGDLVTSWINHYAVHHIMDCPPVTGALEQIKRLAEIYELHIVTSRPEYNRLAVEAWLKVHCIAHLFVSITFTNSFGNDPNAPKTDKPTVCTQLGAVAHIDDALSHAEAVTAVGIRVYMLPRPWNEGRIPEGVMLCSNWQELGDQLMLIAA